MQTRYPIRAVAKITGLSLDTLRAWERRYKAVVPERSDRGRQYGPAHIERLLLLNQLVQKGHAIGGIASRVRPRAAEPSDPSSPASQSPCRHHRRTCWPRFWQRSRVSTRLRASDELSRLAAVLSPRDLVYQVAVPLMREVGIRWHNGTLAIAQEHLVSQMLRTLLGSMMRLFRPPNPAMTMVLSTPAGESHEFGILAAAMLASLAGVEPVYLGSKLAGARDCGCCAEDIREGGCSEHHIPVRNYAGGAKRTRGSHAGGHRIVGRRRGQCRSGPHPSRSQDCT